MMKIGLMFDHGNSLAAAFVLFAIGIGTSLGTLAWLGTDYGWKRILPWFVGYALLTLVIGYGAEPLLYDTRKAEIDHTHAFDDYSSPFIAGTSFISAIEQTRAKLDEKFGPLERPAVYALLGLIGVGWIARRCHGLDRWLTAASTSPSGTADGPWWNRSVPGPVLGLVVLAGLIAFSVIGAYMYYPDRERCLEEMAAVKADAFSASAGRRTEEAIRYLEHWDLLVRKLEVGEYIRTFHVTSEQSKAAEVLREALEDARDKLLAGDKDGARQAILKEVEQAYQAVKAAFPRPIQTSGVTE
jgi:putative effector of murein hydrolase LrgA (UPF0299 family)